MNGTQLPFLKTQIPGTKSKQWIDRLALRECPAITARRARRAMLLGAAKDDPIVWRAALGANVMDVDDNIFVDLTSGFGVAGVGHRAEQTVLAAQNQMDVLVHAMGDAYADPQRILLLEKLSSLSGMDRTILGSSGSDAVEAALKTARLASGKDKVLSFGNAYHGLSLGVLPTTDYKSHMFRGPFQNQLATHVTHHPFGFPLPDTLKEFGAVIVEPIQGRGGIQAPPEGWLAALIDLARRDGAVVIFDEIYTGFGRTGSMFGFQDPSLNGRVPDLLCLGKGMAGGFPISACIGRAEVMDAWGASKGEAIHTQTFLGNPVGCAMALATILQVEKMLPEIVQKGQWLRDRLQQSGFSVRGKGMMLGVEMNNTLTASRYLLQHGFIVLPAGPNAEVLALTPPFVITYEQMKHFVSVLEQFQQNQKAAGI